MKKIISTRFHGILDYCFGLILILPWIVNFNEEGGDTWMLALAGSASVTVSLFTNYELGFIRVIPMKLHLFIDVLVAGFLIALPFFHPINHYYLYWPVMLGAGELLIVAFSSVKPFVVTRRDLNITLPSS